MEIQGDHVYITHSGTLTTPIIHTETIQEKSLLIPRHISGKDNGIADITSRYFNQGELFHAQDDLETYFNLNFTLTYTESWREYRVFKN